MSAHSASPRRRRAIELLAAVWLLLLAGCTSTPLTPEPPPVVFPDSAVSFRLHVQPFLRQGCAFAGCHSSASRVGGVALEEYVQLWERPGLVIPGVPEQSLLVQLLEGQLPHLPDLRARTTENQRQGVRRWIAEGAQNN